MENRLKFQNSPFNTSSSRNLIFFLNFATKYLGSAAAWTRDYRDDVKREEEESPGCTEPSS